MANMIWWIPLILIVGWGCVTTRSNSVSYLDWDSVSAEDDGPEHVTAILGQSVVLNCPVDFPENIAIPYIIQWQKLGVKIPIYIWYHGYPPHRGEGYEGRIALATDASLNISDVRESDQGWYECKIFFLNRPPDAGKNGTWLHLDVHAPPHFTVTPQEVIYVKVRDSIFLNCEAEGTPKPDIVWYKGEKPLEPSSNIQIYNDGREVKIMSLLLSDIGDYTCVARNAEGEIKHTTKVIVAGRAVIYIPPSNRSEKEGDKVEFVCEARALPGNITHRWYRNDIEIKDLAWLETRTVIRKDGTLIINPLTADDMGKYTCEVSNGIGTPHTASAYLNVDFPARVTYTPTVQYLPLGLSGIVHCYFEANPPHQFVTWVKDSRQFEPSATPGYVALANGSLLIQTVTSEHQGLYTCTPYNSQGTTGMSNLMEVLVRDPPVITKMPQDMYQRTVNGEVKMPCEATGTPIPKISWRRRDGAKFPHERYSIRGGNLTIKSLRKEDHGYYECVVQNDVATLVVGTLLLVESTTPHAPTNVSVNTSTFEATVSWLPAYDGGFAQHYLVWYRESSRGDNAWRTLRVYPDGASTYTIFSLSPNTEYDFQVLSRNELGDGMFSDIVTATTKPADYTMPVLPTDSSGSTYIPTIVKPSAVTEHRGYSAVPDSSPPAGPKPGSPREVHVRLASDGVVISWLPPANSTVPVVYYVVEYKTELNSTWLPIAEKVLKGYTYTMKNLIPGKKFFFRVKAATTTHYSDSSPEVEFTLPPPSQEKAITAGIVGGFLFFIVAIILSVCTVKICNKRKRRKQEKVLSLLKSQRQSSDMGEAYNMVACRVADARNGGHGPAGSPVALKNKPGKISHHGHSQSRVSGLNLATVKRKLKGLVSLAPHFKPSLEESSRQFGDSQEWGRDDYRPPHRLPQHQQQQHHHQRLSPIITSTTERGRRFPKTVRYNVEMEYSQPLGWISRTPEGKFVLDEGFVRRDHIPSSQASLQGSCSSRGSRESVLGSELRAWLTSRGRSTSRDQWQARTPVVQTIYEPRDPRYRVARTSSPGPLAYDRPFRIDDISSVQPSSGERSLPSTVSSRLHSHSYELPSLRILHEQLPYIREEFETPVLHHHLDHHHLLSPVYRAPLSQRTPYEVRAEIHREPDESYYQIPPQPRRVQQRQPQPTSRIIRPHPDIRHSLVPSHMVPTGPSPVAFRYRFQGDPSLHPAPVPRYIHPPPGPRPIRMPVLQVQPPGVFYTSPVQPFARPLATSSPPQNERRVVFPLHPTQEEVEQEEQRASVSSSEDRPVTYTRDRLQETIGRVRSGFVVRSERLPFRQVAPDSNRGRQIGSSRYSPATTEEDSVHVALAVAPNSRTSVTSASSGRGSKHSRTDSIQGDVQYSPSSSSGFASRNTSQSQPSPHAISGANATVAGARYELAGQRNPLDVSVDENYEFDSVSPIELARQWRGASDSELYANLYASGGKRLRSKYDDVEIERRIPALKEEFQQFRRRQLERRRSEELESEC